MQRMRGHCPQFLQCTRRINPDEFQPVANVAVSGAASRTIAAGVQGANRHAISGRPCCYAVTDGHDCAGHLMSNHLRSPNPVIHSSVEDMQVSPADPAMRNLDLDLT